MGSIYHGANYSINITIIIINGSLDVLDAQTRKWELSLRQFTG